MTIEIGQVSIEFHSTQICLAYCIPLLVRTCITLDTKDDQTAAVQVILARLFDILRLTQPDTDILCDAVGFDCPPLPLSLHFVTQSGQICTE